MPNYCNYGMVIKGKKEDREKLVDYLKSDYNYERDPKTDTYILKRCEADKHFSRVFEVFPCEEDDERTYVSGDCAWSVKSCMLTGPFTYYDKFKDAINSKCTNMLEATKELDLVVEIYSQEPGCCFMEHYIINKGELQVDECVEWNELYDEEGEPIYDDNGEQLSEGGFDWDFTI